MSAAVTIKVSLVLGVWLRDVHHLIFIPLHTVQEACWSNWILRRISSAVHTVYRYCGCGRCVFTFHCFPPFSIFCHFDPCVVVLYFIAFRFFSFLWLEEVIYFIFPSLFGLPTGLFVWCSVLRPGFHFVAFFAHRSSGSDAILIVKRHFILLCVSIQHGILAAFILSTAAAVLFTCSIQSSLFSLVSISSSVSFMKEMSLSWSQSVCVELRPSAVPSSELLWFVLFVFVIFLVPAADFSFCILSQSYHSSMFL